MPHTITEANGTIIKTSHFCYREQDAFDKLAELTRGHECWTFIKPHVRARNGRAAYMAFKNRYLGPNNIGNMAETAEHKLINGTYRGEGRSLDFERYATLHKEQNTILEGLKECEYQGIKTTALDSVRTQILCNAVLMQIFTKCIVLFKDYIMQPMSTSPKSSILHQAPPRLKLNRKRGNAKEELRICITPSKNTRHSQMSRRRNSRT